MNIEKRIKLSLVIPVYNRPQELKELLKSLEDQTNQNFEVIVVDDGSEINCENEVSAYKSKLNIQYYFKPNSGPGQTRNYGSERATGNYMLFFDSDCTLPQRYIEIIYKELATNYVDAYGGPDKADKSFTYIQRAINYAMTSFFTTGGIRGGGEKMDKFFPRSFNMGFSKDVFQETKGFSKMRFGEDIDMSIRILKHGFCTRLIKEAYVYHKRRVKFSQFFKQIYNSGIARINLYKRHPHTLKLIHFLPSFFVLGLILLIILISLFSKYFLLFPVLFSLLIFFAALLKTKNVLVALLSVYASFLQLISYGLGFLFAFWKRLVFSKDEYSVFEDNFYK